MKRLYFFCLLFVCAGLLKAQGPAGAIRINQTQVQGGIDGECLNVTTGKIGQQACPGGGSATSIDAGGATSVTNGAANRLLFENGSAKVSTSSQLTWNGTTLSLIPAPADSGTASLVMGTPFSSFTSSPALTYSAMQWNYKGTSNCCFALTGINVETTDEGEIGLFINSATSGGAGTNYGLWTGFTNLGTQSVGQIVGGTAQNVVSNTGNITTEVGWESQAPLHTGAGALLEHVGFDAKSSSIASNNNISFQSSQAGGSGNYALYINSANAAGIKNASVAFASLQSNENGTTVYCNNCTVTSGSDDTCATGGTGAYAARLLGVWRCWQ